jgi:hypothetical protein
MIVTYGTSQYSELLAITEIILRSGIHCAMYSSEQVQ